MFEKPCMRLNVVMAWPPLQVGGWKQTEFIDVDETATSIKD